MNSALAVRDDSAIAVTSEQLDLIKRTVANGATADELKLYLFDCQRQGVHPLDKLVHFTKRAGKYTPITSIDFMRIRAAESGEYAGSDDAVFSGDASHDMGAAWTPSSAFMTSVTVWRLVQGQRCPFTATARWSEYKPDQNDFMWKKMPHTMLAKCAEALALRKGFPRQLSGLYAKEEMDQADGPTRSGTSPTTPPVGNGKGQVVPADSAPKHLADDPEAREKQSKPGGAAVTSAVAASESGFSDEGPDLGADVFCPEGYALIDDYKPDGIWHHIYWGHDAQGGSLIYKTKLAKVGNQARTAYNDRVPVRLHSKKYPWLDEVERLEGYMPTNAQVAATKWNPDDLENQGL